MDRALKKPHGLKSKYSKNIFKYYLIPFQDVFGSLHYFKCRYPTLFVYLALETQYKTKQDYEAIYTPKHITFTYRNTLFWG